MLTLTQNEGIQSTFPPLKRINKDVKGFPVDCLNFKILIKNKKLPDSKLGI